MLNIASYILVHVNGNGVIAGTSTILDLEGVKIARDIPRKQKVGVCVRRAS